MSLARHNLKLGVHDTKYNPVPFINADTPPARKVIFQWFGIANAIVAIPLNALDERIDTPDCPPITATLPSEIVVPAPVMPNLMHEQIPGHQSTHAPNS